MPAEILSRHEKDLLIEQLKNRFGIEKLPYLLFKTGKEKIRAFSGHLSRDELNTLFKTATVEIIGIYLVKEEKKNEARLSLDANHLLHEQISKNIFILDEQQAKKWMKGEDIYVDKDLFGFYILKNDNDFMGCGKASQGRMINFIPKERRVR